GPGCDASRTHTADARPGSRRHCAGAGDSRAGSDRAHLPTGPRDSAGAPAGSLSVALRVGAGRRAHLGWSGLLEARHRRTLLHGGAHCRFGGGSAGGVPRARAVGGPHGGGLIVPQRLSPGGLVSLVAPAGPLAEGAVEMAVERVRALGWSPEVGPHAWQRHGYLAGPDAGRTDDLQAAVDSPHNEAIWCLRGGYGTMRILGHIDFSELVRRPRPLIGFSDNTVL